MEYIIDTKILFNNIPNNNMGFITAIIVFLVGCAITFIIDYIPADVFVDIIPICWFPGTNCLKSYNTIKTYVVVFLIALVVWFVPMV